MKKKSREINVFSMAALDIFASAMGVFMLIAVVLFPYYMKNSEAVSMAFEARAIAEQKRIKAEKAMAEANRSKRQAEEAISKAEKQKKRADAAEKELKKTHLQVVITWEWPISHATRPIKSNDDVDLYVVTPKGDVFSYRNMRIPGSDGELLVDTMHTPGGEIWYTSNAEAGIYAVCVNRRTNDRHGEIPIRGSVIHRGGHLRLEKLNLGTDALPMAAVHVSESGEVSAYSVERRSLVGDSGIVNIVGLNKTMKCPTFVLTSSSKY